MEPKVSVVVSVFNGEKNIGKKVMEESLNSLFKQDYGNYEIVLINDGSTDGTDKTLQRFKDRVIYTKNKTNQGLAASRNKGIHLARGKYVAFTDADCVADPSWLTQLVQCLIENKARGAGGPVKTPQEIGYFARCVGTLHKPSPKLRDENKAEVPGCNAIFESSLFVEMSGFDETFKESNADTDFNVRVWLNGTEIYYQPTAVVYHYHRSSLPSFLRWRFMNGIGLYRLAKKHAFKAKKIYHLFNLTLIPFILLIGLSGLLIKPMVLPWLLCFLYGAQFLSLYARRRGEFTVSEILFGVLLGWLLRLSGSLGFWYGMVTLGRVGKNKKEGRGRVTSSPTHQGPVES